MALEALARFVALEPRVARTIWTGAAQPALHAQELAFEELEAHLRRIRIADRDDPVLRDVAAALYRIVTADAPCEMRAAFRDLKGDIAAAHANGTAAVPTDLHRARILAGRWLSIFAEPFPERHLTDRRVQ